MAYKPKPLSLQEEYDQLSALTIGQLREMDDRGFRCKVVQAHRLAVNFGAVHDDRSNPEVMDDIIRMPWVEQVDFLCSSLNAIDRVLGAQHAEEVSLRREKQRTRSERKSDRTSNAVTFQAATS